MSKQNSSITKITRPKTRNIIERQRLYKLLDKTADKSVTWVSAPGGSGKTSIVSSCLNAKNLSCIWYQCDEGDADIATFFYYMGLAAKKAAPRYRKPLPLLTPEYVMGIPTFTKRYFENLGSRLTPPFVIVLDNYQDVPEQSEFHNIIVNAADSLPPGITLIALSRGNPPSQYARLRANNDMGLIGWNDVRFTLEESGEMVGLRSREKISREVMERFHEKSNGWAAGLALLTERYNAGETDLHFLEGEHPPEEIFEYFAFEICSRMDSNMQDFLIKTSFLPHMTPDSAQSVSGNSHAPQILSELNRRNCFTEKRALPDVSYQYHPLFRGYLQSKAKKELPQEDVLKLQIKAADLLENSGNIEDAAHLYKDAKEWNRLALLTMNNAMIMMERGRSGTLEEWLNSIPPAKLEQNSWLLYWKGICRLPYDPAEARGYLEKAFKLFEEEQELSGLFLSWSAIVDTFSYEWGDFKPLDHWIAVMDSLIADNPKFPAPEIEVRVAAGMLNALTNRQPGRSDLSLWAGRVQRIVMTSDNINLRMALGNQLVFYYLWVGDFSKITVVIDALRPSIGFKEYDPLTKQNWYVMEAMYSWFAADWKTCRQAISDGMKNAEDSGVHLLDLYLLAQGVYGGLSLGDAATAESCMEKISFINSPRLGDRALYHYQASSVAWYHRDFKKSEEHGRHSVRITEDMGWSFPVSLCLIELAVTLFDAGLYSEAEGCLTRALDICRGMKMLEFMASLNGARFALQRDMEKQGLVFLERGMALGARYGFFNMPRWNDERMSLLCAIAIEKEIEVEYVRQLIRKRNLTPSGIHAPENWPYPLKIYTLGRFEIAIDDTPVIFSGKVQKKPLELLKALIAFGGNSVNEDQLTDALWPDVDGDSAHRSFDTTLHRLRKLLGNDKAIQLQEGQLTLDRRYCHVDVWAFERILEQTEKLWKESEAGKDVITEAVGLSEKAIGMYKGLFLPADVMQSWAISKREHLRNKFLRLIMRTGQGLEQAGRLENAIECFRKGLEADDIAEEFYRHLMLCYQRLGLKSEAVKIYNHCRAMLSAHLGISPSSKTEEIYKGIVQSAYPHKT